MSELLKIVLSLSLSGTLLFFIILVLKPLYKSKLSKRWQYYVWLIVIVRMLIPFTLETTLVGSAFNYLDNIDVETIQTIPPANDTQSDFGSDDNFITPNAESQAPKSTIDTSPSLSIQAVFSKVYESLWILWAAIAFALLIRKITMYQSFVRFVKAGRAEVSDIKILNMLADAGEAIGVKRPVELFTNPLISSPMLLGFFRPYIILPSIELDSTELAYIMQHELTHYKRLDMFYKWFTQITVCLHWFNPFAYLLAKEINKCCELSCDEAIIKTLDKDGTKAYGDTLLDSLNATGQYNDKLAAIALTEGAAQLKERLDAIMSFKRKSKAMVAITLVLTTMLCIGATAVGAYAAPQTAIPQIPVNVNTPNKAEVSYDEVYAKWDITHIDDTYYYQNEPVRIFMDLRADNSFANFSYNENGRIDLRLVRNSSDSIVKVEHMSKAEADEILSDLDMVSAQSQSIEEDIERLTLEDVADDMRLAINSCDDKTWYVIEGHGRRYIYYNNLPHNYAYQYEPNQNNVRIVDTGKSTSTYVLLSVPVRSNLTISYNSKSVTVKNVQGVASALQDLNTDNTNSTFVNIDNTSTSKNNVSIEQIGFVLNGKKVQIKTTFLSQIDTDIDDIYVRIKFPNDGINVDYNTKSNLLWKLSAKDEASFTWGLSYEKPDYFTIAITAYKTMDGIMHDFSDDDIEWKQFYYPGSDSIVKNNRMAQTTINKVLYGKQYFPINLTAGDICTAHLSWDGDGSIYLVYVDSEDFDFDENGDILLSQFSKKDSEGFKYEFPNDKTTTFIVPKDGLYVFPVKDNSNGKVTHIVGEINYPAY